MSIGDWLSYCLHNGRCCTGDSSLSCAYEDEHINQGCPTRMSPKRMRLILLVLCGRYGSFDQSDCGRHDWWGSDAGRGAMQLLRKKYLHVKADTTNFSSLLPLLN